jgi:PDZ domain-containing protein
LTDVTLQHATLLLLALAAVPGVRLVRQDAVVPRGITPRTYDRILADAMDQSQSVAAVVAERAAGLHVPDPPVHVYVSEILPSSPARGTLHAGDELLRVDATRVAGTGQVLAAVDRLPAGARVAVALRRGVRVFVVRVPTMQLRGATRLGIVLERRAEKPALPIGVRFNLDDVSGSSGGLMFALQIYGALHRDARRPGTSIAGTGTIAYDGSVGPIEGTRQKLIAAKRVGARIFFVPRANYTEVASERDVRVVPVGNFRDALAALRS